MALFFLGSSPCALCGRVVATSEDLVATSHFLGPEHPLARFSDAAMHRTCFSAWARRGEFVAAYNAHGAETKGA